MEERRCARRCDCRDLVVFFAPELTRCSVRVVEAWIVHGEMVQWEEGAVAVRERQSWCGGGRGGGDEGDG